MQVAGRTSQGRMLAFQRETSRSVVEIGHAVNAIMAGQTINPVVLQVSGHIDLVVVRVTILAGLQHQREATTSGMAGITIHRHRVIIQLVPAQAESGLIVVEMLKSRHRYIGIPAKMVGVAVPALLNIGHAAMGARLGDHLVENWGVAAQAQVGLGRLEWRVAIGTLGFEIHMGVEAT